MAEAPDPVTAAPAPNGPYDATASGAGDAQSDAAHVYDAAGSTGGDWVKVQDGGACDMNGRVTGGWPDDGAGDGSAWVQV